MNELISTAIATTIGLTIGSFIYQGITDKNWWKAVEMSISQAVAVGVFLFNISGK